MALIEAFKTAPLFEFGNFADLYFRASNGVLTAIAVGTASGMVLATTGSTATPYQWSTATSGGSAVAAGGDIVAATVSSTATLSLTLAVVAPLKKVVSTSSPATVTLSVNLAVAGPGSVSTGTDGTATLTVNVVSGPGVSVSTASGTATVGLAGSATGTSVVTRRVVLEAEFFSTGDKFEFPIFGGGTISLAEVVGDVSGTATCDVLVAPAASTLTFASIVASAPPVITGVQRNQDTTLTGWSKTLNDGDTVRLALTSTATGLGRVALTIAYTVTDTVSTNLTRLVTLQREFTAAGQTLELTIDDNMVIQAVALVADTTTATATIAIQRASAASTLTYSSIVGTSTPAMTGAQRLVDNVLNGWSTTLTAGDTLRFSSSNLTGAARVAVALKCLIGSQTSQITQPVSVSAPIRWPVRTVGTSDSVLDTDYTIRSTATGTITLTLPDATTRTGQVFQAKLAVAGVLILATSASQTIDGASTKTLNVQYSNMTVQSNGANWDIL